MDFFICCFPSKFKIRHRQHNIPLEKRISICDFLLFATNLPSEMPEMYERFLPFLPIFFCFLIAYSEFFWTKLKRFSEFHFIAKFWVFELKMRFWMMGEQKNGERRRKASLHWDHRLNFTSSREGVAFLQRRKISLLRRFIKRFDRWSIFRFTSIVHLTKKIKNAQYLQFSMDIREDIPSSCFSVSWLLQWF